MRNLRDRRRRQRVVVEDRSVTPVLPRVVDLLHRSAGGVLLLSLRSWSIHRLLGRPGRRFQLWSGRWPREIDMTPEFLVSWRVLSMNRKVIKIGVATYGALGYARIAPSHGLAFQLFLFRSLQSRTNSDIPFRVVAYLERI